MLDADRRFTITVDGEPAGGRPNHVRSSPEAHEFYIRDVMLDWERDEPNELAIERLGGPPPTPPRTLDEQAELTARVHAEVRQDSDRWNAQSADSRQQARVRARLADKGGALRNQVYIGGHFQLGDDEAMVVNVSDGGAAYFVVPSANIWGTTLDIVDRTGSLNKAQSVAERDGTYTYVLSRRDPGVHNWIDPCGHARGHPHAAHGGVPGRAAEPRPARREPRRAARDAARAAARRRRLGDAGRARAQLARARRATRGGCSSAERRWRARATGRGSSPAARPASAATSRRRRSRRATASP